jgi:lipoyl(octanoyl) transferase 2
MHPRVVQVFNLGRLDYSKCLNIQKYFLNKKLFELSNNKPSTSNNEVDTLLLVEHEPVYTIGIRRSQYPLVELEKLKNITNAQIMLTDRGGLITFHGHGQLVGYPILNLRNYKSSLKWYVSQLESTIINLCQEDYNLKANRLCNVGYTGVWVNDSKVAAIGVHCKKYITYHGMAINCNVNLDWFSYIVPCGISDKKVTSLTNEISKKVTIEEVIPLYLKHFSKKFECNLIIRNEKETKQLLDLKI